MSHKRKLIVRNSHNWSEVRVGRILRRIGIRCKDGRQGCAVVQVDRRSVVGEMEFGWLCVDVVVYIEGYIFDILRRWGLSMPLFVLHSLRKSKLKIKKLADDVGVC
jgi:hypothetical protein